MSFNGTEGAPISPASGAALTAKFRRDHPTMSKGLFYGKDKLQDLLNQTGCKGIRIYFGKNATGDMELVLVGADANENDILTLIIDNGVRCPSHCGTANSLNS